MPKHTQRASLVGMRYHSFSTAAGATISSERVMLVREPHNRHDPNAVAVHISGVIAGHVNRDAAATISTALQNGATCCVSDFAWTIGTGSIPLSILIQTEDAPPAVPDIPVGTCGVYCIEVKGCPEVYIGQSRDIRSRIQRHWRELALRLHPNPRMQELWLADRGRNFSARIVQAAPYGMDDSALSEWLYDREIFWIEHYDARGGVTNFDKPERVLVGVDRERARLGRQLEREKIRASQPRRDALEKKIEAVSDVIWQKEEALHEVQRRIRAASGLKGFFFASSDEHKAVPRLVAETGSLKKEIGALELKLQGAQELLNAMPSMAGHGRERLSKRTHSRVAT